MADSQNNYCSPNDVDRCPECGRLGQGTRLHACGVNVYACLECDIYWHWCRKTLSKVDIGAIKNLGDGI